MWLLVPGDLIFKCRAKATENKLNQQFLIIISGRIYYVIDYLQH